MKHPAAKNPINKPPPIGEVIIVEAGNKGQE